MKNLIKLTHTMLIVGFLSLLVGCSFFKPKPAIEIRTVIKLPPPSLLNQVVWPNVRIAPDGTVAPQDFLTYTMSLESQLLIQRENYKRYQSYLIDNDPKRSATKEEQ